MDRSTTVRDYARDLPPGGSRAGLLCPQCRGGASGERTFSVWRDEQGIGYKCHRNSCPTAGVRTEVPDMAAQRPPGFMERPYPYGITTPPVDHDIWNLLRVPYGDRHTGTAAKLGVFTRVDDSNEVVWEIRGYDYSTRGHLSRTYPSKVIRTWRLRDLPWHGFLGWDRRPVLFIVEDMVSAARIMLEGGNALALLSTHFSADGRHELGRYLKTQPKTLVKVALDPDATATGAQLVRELTFQLGCDILFMPLKNDPKDLEPAELRRMIAGT